MLCPAHLCFRYSVLPHSLLSTNVHGRSGKDCLGQPGTLSYRSTLRDQKNRSYQSSPRCRPHCVRFESLIRLSSCRMAYVCAEMTPSGSVVTEMYKYGKFDALNSLIFPRQVLAFTLWTNSFIFMAAHNTPWGQIIQGEPQATIALVSHANARAAIGTVGPHGRGKASVVDNQTSLVVLTARARDWDSISMVARVSIIARRRRLSLMSDYVPYAASSVFTFYYPCVQI